MVPNPDALVGQGAPPAHETAEMAKEHRATHPMEAKYLPQSTQTFSNLETVQRTEVKKGVARQVEMIALETYDRDREPEQGEHAQHDGSAEGEQLEAQHLVRSPLPSFVGPRHHRVRPLSVISLRNWPCVWCFF